MPEAHLGSESATKLLVGFSQGSVSNIVARLLAPALARALGRAVQIVELPGDNGGLAAQRLAQSAPDGSTLAMAVPTHLIGSLLGQASRYDPLSDFCAVDMVARNPLILAVSNSLGAGSVGELVALARARPGELIYGASALGGGPHLCAAQFAVLTGIRLQRRVYAETNTLFDDLADGRIALTFNNPTSVLREARAGRLKMLGVTGCGESALVPGVPALAASAVPGFEFTSWVGILAPANTPAGVLVSLHAAVRSATAIPEVRQRLQALGLERVESTSAEFSAHLHAEFHRWLAFARAHREAFPGLREEKAA